MKRHIIGMERDSDHVYVTGSSNHGCKYPVCGLFALLELGFLLTDLYRGSKAHFSSKDRDDKQEVITVGLQTNAGTRIGSLHVHLSGTFKFFPSRAGREGGYYKNIAQANIPGHIPEDGGE